MNWTTLTNSLVSVVLGGGLVGAYISLRRLRGQKQLDAAQRDSLITATAKEVVEMTSGQLKGCQKECARLRVRMDLMEQHIRQLERIMHVAGLPLPTWPGNGGGVGPGGRAGAR